MEFSENAVVYHPQHGIGRVALSGDDDFIVEFDSGAEEVFLTGMSAAELPVKLHPEGFHLLRRDHPETVAAAVASDPVGLAVRISRDYGQQIDAARISALLKGNEVDEDDWEPWIKALLSRLDADPRFTVSCKNKISYIGEIEEISLGLLEKFKRAVKMKDKLKVCKEFIKAGERGVPVERNRAAAVSFFINVIRGDSNLPGARIEALLALQSVSPEDAEKTAGELANDLRAIPIELCTDRIADINETALRRQFLDLLWEIRGGDFPEIIVTLIRRFRRLRDFTLDYLFADDKHKDTLNGLVGEAVGNISTSINIFLWVCGVFFKGPDKLEKLGIEKRPFIQDMFKHLSRTHLTGAFSSRPKDGPYVSQDESEMLTLLRDRKALKRVVEALDVPTGTEFLRLYAMCTAIVEDERIANVAEFQTLRPELSGHYATRTAEQEKTQITRETHDKYNEEFRRIVDVEIPANVEQIRIAREWGDLRENAEYQTARDKQELLRARKIFLERVLGSCEVID